MSDRFSYRRWDGTQDGFDPEADWLFGRISDDLLYHGDPEAALRRLMNAGFDLPDGTRVEGLRELMERLRWRREQELERYDAGGAYEQVAAELAEVLAEERAGLEDLAAEARRSGDERRIAVTEEVVAERSLQLDLLAPDLAGRLRGLQAYEFTSERAREHFEELVGRLKDQVAKSWFDQMSGALSDPDPEHQARVRECLDALNRMLEQRERGEEIDPSFEDFMERFSDMFPGNPSSLDELLEQMAAQMAAVQAALASMSAEQRAELEALAAALFEDLDLRWQVDRLSANLRRAFPDAGWQRSYGFSGSYPATLSEAADAARRLGEMEELEAFLRAAGNPAAMAEVDLDQVRRYLGDDAARSIENLSRLAAELEEAGLIAQREGRYSLTARGIRHIGQGALRDLFARMPPYRAGSHRSDSPGAGHELEGTTRPYEAGDPFRLDIDRTVRNALTRNGAGVPVGLAPEDFEIAHTEALTQASTVLMVDLSLSMPMRDNFLAAKKVAMALHALISTRFRRDFLGIVGFSEVAREITPEELPQVSWDFVYGTNMQHGLMLARRMLAHRPGTRQIVMVTDGEPTAHLVPDSSGQGYEVSFHYPPTAETIYATLAEVARCTRAGIVVNTFMLDPDQGLHGFVQQMAKLNRGRAFFTSPDTLGDYVLVDFLESRRTSSGHRRGA